MSVSNYFKSAKTYVCAAGSYFKRSPGILKEGVLKSASSVLYQGISKPIIPQFASFEQKVTRTINQGQKSALKSLDQGVAEIKDCAKSAQKLLKTMDSVVKTVDSVVKTGAELVGFVAGLYVFNFPGKTPHISRFACTAQKVAGFSIAAVASLHWLGRMTKPYIEEHVLRRLLPNLKFW